MTDNKEPHEQSLPVPDPALMWDRLKLPNPEAFPQPEWNRADSVAAALDAVVRSEDESASWAAYNQLLNALGNNHAGTYYPVVLAVLPALEGILREERPWPQHAVLNVLIELCSSFQPEPGYETFRGLSVASGVAQAAAGFKAIIESLAHGNGAVASSAKELLELLA